MIAKMVGSTGGMRAVCVSAVCIIVHGHNLGRSRSMKCKEN